MASHSEMKRPVLASVIAVLMAVSLVVSISYAFPASAGTATTTVTTNGYNPNNVIGENITSSCLSSVPNTLVLPGYNTGSPSTTTTVTEYNINSNEAVSIYTITKPGILPFANVTLAANGTTTIEGKTYWYVTFIPLFTSYMDEAYIKFQGVTFFLSSIVQYEYSGKFGLIQITSNGTAGTALPADFKIAVINPTTLVAKTSSGSPCTYFLPSFTVEWGGNQAPLNVSAWENYNQASISFSQIGANRTNAIDQEIISFPSSLSNPWFTQHVDPQAGVSYQANGGEITLYVSVS